MCVSACVSACECVSGRVRERRREKPHKFEYHFKNIQVNAFAVYERLRPTHLAEKFIYSSANNIAPSHSLSLTHALARTLARTRTHMLLSYRSKPKRRLGGQWSFCIHFFVVPVGASKEDCEHFEEIHNNAVQPTALRCFSINILVKHERDWLLEPFSGTDQGVSGMRMWFSVILFTS